MAPLFAAIAHGCAAGRHDEAFLEVYIPRIARGNERFAIRRSSASSGSDLAAIAHFFAEPFAEPAPGSLTRARRLWCSTSPASPCAGWGASPKRWSRCAQVAKLQADQEDWSNAASGHSNLSELLATLGRLEDDAIKGEADAVTIGAQCVEYADKSGDAFMRIVGRATHADALLQAGAWAEADRRFVEAEVLERDLNPEFPLFGSFRGYLLCDLRLSHGRASEAATRGAYALNIARLERAVFLTSAWLLFPSATPRIWRLSLPLPTRPRSCLGGGNTRRICLEYRAP